MTNMRTGVISIFFIFTLMILSSCASPSPQGDQQGLTPEKVVQSYYKSLNNRDYETMYSLISDGFKKIEPTAIDYASFENYMGNFFKTASGVEVVLVKETLNDGVKATVDYSINLLTVSGKKEFSSTFTLKKRATGWKLIHPYGDNIDTS